MRKILAAVLSVLLLCGCGKSTAAGVPVQRVLFADETEAAASVPELSCVAAEWMRPYQDAPAEVRVLLAHDMLCTRCRYDLSAESCHSAEGALSDGLAVCDGYAEAFFLLMQASDIPVMTVIGTAADSDGGQSGHAWNLVQLKGSWYHIDCTWDDTDSGAPLHVHFLCTDEEMAETHSWDSAQYPRAEGGGYRYETIVQEMRAAVTPPSADKIGRTASAFSFH